MEYGRASSVSLNGVSINKNANSANTTIPHYLLPSTGSCHDICKYGRRLPLEQHLATIPIYNTSAKITAKSISPKHKNHPTTQKVQPPSPFQRWDGKRGRRNNGVHSVGNTKKIWVPVGAASGKGRKIGREELLSPRKDQKRAKTDSSTPRPESSSFQDALEINGNEVKANIAQMETEKAETERNELEPITENPSSSSHGEENEEVIKSGDKHSRPTKLKLRIRNSIHLHQENNVQRRHKFKRSRVESAKPYDYVSNHISLRIASRTKDKNGSSKSRRRRARYGKTRILVFENRKSDRRRNEQENDNTACTELLSKKKRLHHHDHLQRKKDAQVLLNYVIEETLSKLAERRKGTVKSLVGAFETLISLQERRCFFQVARVNC